MMYRRVVNLHLLLTHLSVLSPIGITYNLGTLRTLRT